MVIIWRFNVAFFHLSIFILFALLIFLTRLGFQLSDCLLLGTYYCIVVLCGYVEFILKYLCFGLIFTKLNLQFCIFQLQGLVEVTESLINTFLYKLRLYCTHIQLLLSHLSQLKVSLFESLLYAFIVQGKMGILLVKRVFHRL